MSNFINNTQKNFTLIQNEILNNKEMTFELKGLYSYLISKPSGWTFSSDRIATQTNDKLGTIKRLLRELEGLGLLLRTKVKSDQGKFVGVKYEILSTIVTNREVGHCDVTTRDNGYRDNISNTNNNSNTNISNTDKEIMSEQSSDDLFLLNLDVTNQSLEVKITKSFFDLFRKNQKENGVTTFTKYDKTKLKNWLIHIKRMLITDKITLEELREVHAWLDSDKYKNADFWRKNILSTQKLREQFPKLQTAMKGDLDSIKQNKQKRTKSRLGL